MTLHELEGRCRELQAEGEAWINLVVDMALPEGWLSSLGGPPGYVLEFGGVAFEVKEVRRFLDRIRRDPRLVAIFDGEARREDD